ncbi:hypothetical protein SAMN05216403_10535 [Nitrosospira multiformis ATCC 25196]|uniref:Uncharacterized protein n=1 Tax=Nitrosospira multiformis (strain ATCC 25196 / NCIMB 11849 / C 71) TaxID=323848 RepID=A0A1H5TPM2_NITMU|nr:hypothetical protein SAMN05216403_10535 [Nitrosospira multiformis ATCC 25196]
MMPSPGGVDLCPNVKSGAVFAPRVLTLNVLKVVQKLHRINGDPGSRGSGGSAHFAEPAAGKFASLVVISCKDSVHV